MADLPIIDPLPGLPLLCRIDTRNGHNTVFWSRVRKAYLPSLSGHCFWVRDRFYPTDLLEKLPHIGHMVILDRKLILQFLPDFCRLSPGEREVLRMRYWHRVPDYIADKDIVRQLNTTRLVSYGKITNLGWNSYFLSP